MAIPQIGPIRQSTPSRADSLPEHDDKTMKATDRAF